MLHCQGNNNDRIFRPLSFVNAGGIGQSDFIQFVKIIVHGAFIKNNLKQAFIKVTVENNTNIPIEDFLVIIVDFP